MKRTNLVAIALTTLVLTQLNPPKANAQGVWVIPEAAAVVIILGIAYYVWTNSQGVEMRIPVAPQIETEHLEDPEELDEWALYPATRTYQGCRWLAAGRLWDWDDINKKCYIKG